MTTTLTAQELTKAIQDIVSVHENTLKVKSKEAAETLSQLYLEASNYEVGQITGPFVTHDGWVKTWHVEI